ncbi:MAG TPA: hypothetical protein VEK08_02715 [Planctomycetota bacterium]|nr:hypothetical protein [Planctomycetota bacterium]
MNASIGNPRMRGGALVIALEISLLIAVMTTVLVQNAMSENTGTDSLILDTQASYLAESGAEYSIRLLKYNIANNYPLPLGADKVVLSGFLPHYTQFAPDETPRPVCEYKVIRIEPTASRSMVDVDGIGHHFQLYAVTGRGYIPDPVNPERYVEVFVNKMVDLDFVPLFQYLAFYNRFDMEILPGNDMNLRGRIHSNRDIYIGAQPGKKLILNSSSVKSSGSMHRHRKDKTTSSSDYFMEGTVQFKKKGVSESAPVNAANYPTMESVGKLKTPNNQTVPTSAAPSGYDSSFGGYDGNNDGKIDSNSDLPGFSNGVQSRWDGTVQVGANGVPVLEAPTDIRAYLPPVNGETPTHKKNPATGFMEPAASGGTDVPGSFMKMADMVIESNGSTTRIRDGAGTVLFEQSGSNVTVNKLQNSTGNPVVPVTEKQMFDGREYSGGGAADANGMVKVTDIDVAKLNSAFRNDTPVPTRVFPTAAENNVGSIIYAYRTDTTEKSPHGVRLSNGAELNNKLTFVSEDPVYIKGDFNKTSNGKKGSIILADSVNLLSNQWDDSKTAGSPLPKPTGDLEVNAAMMTGAYETIAPNASGAGAKYNGGFENFPRFHEDWSGAGKAVNILGSFVSLFTSTYGKGAWVYGGNKYTAPVRNWNFDKDFLKPENHPPGFPVSVGETRVAWWKGRNLKWWPLP